MKRTSLLLAATIAVGLAGYSAVTGQETPKSADKPKPSTVKVERGPVKVEVTFKGVFEAPEMVEVRQDPEAWASFTVAKAVDAGTPVKAGDTLVEFDTEKIDKAIRDMEADQRLAELALRAAEIDLPLTEKATPLELAAAERAYKNAREDFDKFMHVDKKLATESAEFSVKSSQQYLDNQKEELKQLEKMYRSKDLTEETEEIILKRTRFQVEAAEFSLKNAIIRRDNVLKIDLPRKEKEMTDGLERAEISYTRARNSIPMTLEQKRLSLAKAKYDRARAVEKLANLKKDRGLFTVKAPADGVVYWGKCTQGAWSSSPTKLLKGGTVTGDEVFMTIVKPGPLFVRASVDEKDSRALKAEQVCRVAPGAFPDVRLTGKVQRVALVPVGGGYDVRVAVAPNDVGIVPGMSAAVKAIAYEKADALTLPAGSVFADEVDDEKHYVFKVTAGKAEKVAVKTGKKAGSKVEILEGLAAGDEVLKDKP